MQTKWNISPSRRRGSALIMAIVITMLLFIIGIVFVLTSQKGRAIVTGSEFRQSLDAGTDAVVEQINTVLIEDLFGSDNNLLNKDASDEYWDYPGSDDPWLASLEPEVINLSGIAFCGWRHISDIYGNNFNGIATVNSFSKYYDPTDDKDASQWDGTASSDYYLSCGDLTTTSFLHARIISDEDSTYLIGEDGDWNDPDDYCRWGGRADADGDGVADSRWARVPGITGPQGQNIYTAVRIVDNGGMININTAYRDPRTLNGTPDWDGSQLSHIHLQGIISTTDDTDGRDVTNIQQMRFGNGDYGTVSTIPGSPPYLEYKDEYANDTLYETDVARRFLNPALVNVSSNDYFYTPFDIMDELELRNRFLVESNVNTRCGQAWPVTFFPGSGNVGLENPYVCLPEDTVAQLQNKVVNWFDKLKPDFDTGGTVLGDYNRRHLVTAYSFDRVMAPKVNPWPPAAGMSASLSTAWNNWTNWNNTTPPLNWTYRPISINDLVSSGIPTNEQIEQLAAAIWLGLPADIENHLNFSPLGWLTFTRERIACQMAVNIIDYVDADYIPTKLNTNGGADYYYGYEAKGPKVYISWLGVSKFDPAPLDGIDVEIHYAVSLYNAGVGAVDVSDWRLNIAGTDYTIPASTPSLAAGGTILIIDIADTEGFTVAEGTAATTQFTLTDGRIVLIDSIGRPVDAVVVSGIGTIGDPTAADARQVWNTPARGTKKYIGFAPDEIYVFETDLTTPWVGPAVGVVNLNANLVLPATRITVPIQTDTPNLQLLTIGEIGNVLVVGGTNIGGDYNTMGECWDEFIVDGGGDITVPERGRIDITNLDSSNEPFANIFRYLTVFNPFNDMVDNDGNGKLDNPTKDGIDNDGVNGPDDAGESVFEERTELAIAGRININTAPWYVIAQLPWLTHQDTGVTVADSYKLAQAIVAYRDKLDWSGITGAPNYAPGRQAMVGSAVREDSGFANTAELVNVTWTGAATPYYYDMRRFGKDAGAITITPPDLTADSVNDDLEERDILFQRVSNLVTVRSDVFTAYIAVRVGEEGPMRRVIAIFDRSKVFSPADKPRLVALHPVPDPS